MAKAGLEEDSPATQAVGRLRTLTAWVAEMRALIFELRPGALAEEGLVSALRRQGAAISARGRHTANPACPESWLDEAFDAVDRVPADGGERGPAAY
jgi:signal transduction histidine kinase